MNLFCLHMVFQSWSLGALAWNFQLDLHFGAKILANLTANWKTCGLTKLDKEIDNTYDHNRN